MPRWKNGTARRIDVAAREADQRSILRVARTGRKPRRTFYCAKRVRVGKYAWDDARAPSTDRMTDIPVPPKKPERPPLHGERNGINVLRLRISRRPT
jgi:hypothetical protein